MNLIQVGRAVFLMIAVELLASSASGQDPPAQAGGAISKASGNRASQALTSDILADQLRNLRRTEARLGRKHPSYASVQAQIADVKRKLAELAPEQGSDDHPRGADVAPMRKDESTARPIAESAAIKSIFKLRSRNAGDPQILYTDILSGPNTGGENNNGTYLSIFGSDFGTTQGTSKVFINGVEVTAYQYWGTSQYGLTDVQQITVRPGAAVTSGAIEVEVNGVRSNADHSFTVITGDIYFVDNTIPDGGDGNGDGIIGDINNPFRYADTTFGRADFGAGDTLVLRGTGTPWTDIGHGTSEFLRLDKTGTASDHLMVLGYPGETAEIRARYINTFNGGGYATISGLKFEHNNASVPSVILKSGAVHTRMVNLLMQNADQRGGGSAQIEGMDSFHAVLGVRIKNAGSKSPNDNEAKLFHGIYFNNTSHDVEIGWSSIDEIYGGRGIQVYHGSGTRYNFTIHDNVISNTFRDAIVLSTGTTTGNKIYNNFISHSASSAGIRTSSDAGLEVEIYNNTIVVSSGKAFNFGGGNSPLATIRNNIVYATGTGTYFVQSGSFTDPVTSNNLWFGNGAPPSWDSGSLNVDPQFVNPGNGDYTFQSSSPAVDAGTDEISAGVPLDFGGVARTFDGDGDSTAVIDIGYLELPPALVRAAGGEGPNTSGTPDAT